jgi:hypothetical protein
MQSKNIPDPPRRQLGSQAWGIMFRNPNGNIGEIPKEGLPRCMVPGRMWSVHYDIAAHGVKQKGRVWGNAILVVKNLTTNNVENDKEAAVCAAPQSTVASGDLPMAARGDPRSDMR